MQSFSDENKQYCYCVQLYWIFTIRLKLFLSSLVLAKLLVAANYQYNMVLIYSIHARKSLIIYNLHKTLTHWVAFSSCDTKNNATIWFPLDIACCKMKFILIITCLNFSFKPKLWDFFFSTVVIMLHNNNAMYMNMYSFTYAILFFIVSV